MIYLHYADLVGCTCASFNGIAFSLHLYPVLLQGVFLCILCFHISSTAALPSYFITAQSYQYLHSNWNFLHQIQQLYPQYYQLNPFNPPFLGAFTLSLLFASFSQLPCFPFSFQLLTFLTMPRLLLVPQVTTAVLL